MQMSYSYPFLSFPTLNLLIIYLMLLSNFYLICFSSYAQANFFSLNFTDSTDHEFGSHIMGRTASEPKKNLFPSGKLTKKSLAKFVKELHAVDPALSNEDAACLAATYLFENEHHSRLFYRVSACRQLSGTKAPLPHLNDHLQNVYDLWKQKSTRKSKGDAPDGKDTTLAIRTVAAEHARDQGIAVVQFELPTAVVLENAGKVIIGLRRFGKEDIAFTCLIETLDRTAKGGLDYKSVKDTINFEAGECYKEIEIEIIDDKNWNPDKVFLVRLSLPDGESEEVAKGRICLMTVTIVDDDEPGIIGFEQRIFTVGEGVGHANLTVLREFGADGRIRVPFKTLDGSAKAGADYVSLEGELIFEHGEIRKEISIEISDDLKAEKDEYFEVVLLSADNGAKLSKINRAMVAVTDDDEQNQEMGQLLSKVRSSSKELKIHREAWIEQFRSAMKVSDGDESTLDYVLHVLSFGWKILFAAIPPVGIAGGWVTFFSALTAIGVLTAFVGDVASAFGCLIGLDKSINAITLVAMGTSLPDLFASRTAARLEQTADNAIGNVTGSNSVNVFLGLGLPWLIASLYWASQNQEFKVPAGSLGFSVGLYTAVSLIATGVLLARRMLPLFGNSELGGPKNLAVLCALLFFVLWIIYVGLSALQSYQVIAA